MKKILFLVFLGILSATPTYAERGHGGGFSRGHGGGHGGGWGDAWILPALIGGALIYNLTQPQPAYVQPPPVYVQPEPTYEQGYAPSVAPTQAQYWYFCPEANGYYPYVPSCPRGWQAVPTTPPVSIPTTPYGAPPR